MPSSENRQLFGHHKILESECVLNIRQGNLVLGLHYLHLLKVVWIEESDSSYFSSLPSASSPSSSFSSSYATTISGRQTGFVCWWPKSSRWLSPNLAIHLLSVSLYSKMLREMVSPLFISKEAVMTCFFPKNTTSKCQKISVSNKGKLKTHCFLLVLTVSRMQ